jgi:hypothetical protein
MFSTFKFLGGLLPGSVPGAPTSVGVSRSSDRAVTISWVAPGNNGNRPITGYGVYVTNQNGGFVAAGTTTGPDARSAILGTDAHGSYNGYVYAINAIGNSSVAGGGDACAYYGYNFTTNNCDGYTKYDVNTNGSCGFYRVDTEYNSGYCGYVDPCAGSPEYGEYLSSYCDGYTLKYRYSDGCNGYYDQTIQNNSTTCGYNPCAGCLASGTYLSSYCDGYTLIYQRANGCCGSYDEEVEYNSPSCGWNPCSGCPRRGSYVISGGCDGCAGNPGCDATYVFPDGCCGSYSYCYDYSCCYSG